LADFQNNPTLRPDCTDFADFVLVRTHEEFLSVLYRNIDKCIKLMEEDPSIRQDDGEDRLTDDFKLFLRAKGYQATHDEKIGGHCDLVVRQHDKPYVWLGEAKVYDGCAYLMQGFNQLCTRYSSGATDTNQGGLLIYIRHAKAASILVKWQERLAECDLADYDAQDCPSRPKLAFFSTHCHESSGLPFRVRHMAVILHFQPQDK
jgi:hypothetical protein